MVTLPQNKARIVHVYFECLFMSVFVESIQTVSSECISQGPLKTGGKELVVGSSVARQLTSNRVRKQDYTLPTIRVNRGIVTLIGKETHY